MKPLFCVAALLVSQPRDMWEGFPFQSAAGVGIDGTSALVRVKKKGDSGVSVRLSNVVATGLAGQQITWFVGVRSPSESWDKASWLKGETWTVRSDPSPLADVKVFVSERWARSQGFAPGAHDIVLMAQLVEGGTATGTVGWSDSPLLFKDGRPTAVEDVAPPAVAADAMASCVQGAVARGVPPWDADDYCKPATAPFNACYFALLDRKVPAWDADDYCGSAARSAEFGGCLVGLVDRAVPAWDADDYCRPATPAFNTCMLGLVDRKVPAWDADDYCAQASPAVASCILGLVDSGTAAWDAAPSCKGR